MKKTDELMALPENENESRANVFYEYLAEKNDPALDIFLDLCVDFFNNFSGEIDLMEEIWGSMIEYDYQPTYEIFKTHLKEIVEKL